MQEHKAAAGAPERAACYGPADLRIGRTVSVYGRDFLITDCDDFTRKWLQARASHNTCISCIACATLPLALKQSF